MKTNKDVLSALKLHSDQLFERVEQFKDICAGIKISSFYELLPVKGWGVVRHAIPYLFLPPLIRRHI